MVLVTKFLLNGNANDSVGSNNGTPTSVTWNAGALNTGASMTTTGYINCGDVLNEEYNVPSTYCFAIKTTDSGTDKHIISKQKVAANNKGKRVNLKTGKIGLFVYSGTTSSICKQTTTTMNDGKWHYIVIAYDGSGLGANVKIYVDGNIKTLENWTSRTQSISATVLHTDTFQINGRWNGTNSTTTMSIDEIEIYSHQLTAGQIKTKTLYYKGCMI